MVDYSPSLDICWKIQVNVESHAWGENFSKKMIIIARHMTMVENALMVIIESKNNNDNNNNKNASKTL